MPHSFTLFTGQWADLPLEEVARLASSVGATTASSWPAGATTSSVHRALTEPRVRSPRSGEALLEPSTASRSAPSPRHLVGQAVCDAPIDRRHQGVLPARDLGRRRRRGRAASAPPAELADTARAAAGARRAHRVNGFTGSSIWHTVAMFPPTAGLDDRGRVRRLRAALDTRSSTCSRPRGCVSRTRCTRPRSPTTTGPTARALAAVRAPGRVRPELRPEPLRLAGPGPGGVPVGVPGPRSTTCDCKDARTRLDGRNGRLGSHLPWGDPRRGWDFCSGRSRRRGLGGRVPDAQLASATTGPISVEWEDAGTGLGSPGRPARWRSCVGFDYDPPQVAFDTAFSAGSAGPGRPPAAPRCAPRPRGGTSPTHRPLTGAQGPVLLAWWERLPVTCAACSPIAPAAHRA